ncbi:predicted protein [Nematostella vectensis]|uniref:Major facilitator superfamily (MFS) profile domain-containing protein n=1 Tax=Nematostella vectensis TaxID=45351 RepID=A7RP46_NEMVE|nr:predicted protein [Nematostella vectensis]|eukprot:XP_001638913.1 predicted protein [Nematostella vectensis]
MVCGRAPHPQDGAWAWLCCLSAAVCNSLHFGFTQSFGVFLPILAEVFNENREKTAWAGSIALFLTFLVGPVAALLSQRFSPRTVTLVSGLLCAASLLSTSFATSIVYIYFTYGVLFGTGAGCILNMGYAVARQYFTSRYRSLTTGVIASGAGVGVIMTGPILQAVIDAVGWRDTLRVMSGIMLIIYTDNASPDVPPADNQTNPSGHKTHCLETFIDCSVWNNRLFVIGAIAIFLAYLPLFVPNIHIVRFATDLHISSDKASWLFTYIGVTSTVCRAIIGKVLDMRWVTPLQGVQISSLLMGVSIIALGSATEYTHFVVFAVFYGVGNGIFVTTQAVFFQTSVAPSKSAMGMGMGFMTCSVAILIGPPICGKSLSSLIRHYVKIF